jgi:preprotein translocase subunit SecA
MKTPDLPIPSLRLGIYPEQRESEQAFRPRFGTDFDSLFGRRANSGRRFDRLASRVEGVRSELAALPSEARERRLRETRKRFRRDGLAQDLVVEAFAHVAHAFQAQLGVRLHEVQLQTARIILDGQLAEMATGEGKTMAAAVAAATAGLAGIPVHVITVNDYLVARDAELLRPVYAALGLSVGTVVQTLDAESRRRAYATDIVYCSAKELVFDYLRDRIARGGDLSELQLRAARLATGSPVAGQLLLRGLYMAIVDEADSILIDEARVPLILSRAGTSPQQMAYYAQALTLAAELEPERDFTLASALMSAELTAAGRERVDARAATLGAVWRNRLQREETLCQALAGLHLFQRDRHYLVRDGAVVIIDENTGRLAPGRIWSRGLHQMIEIKEQCDQTGEQVTAAQITYQRFFRRYLRLGGMSGTLAEARRELRSVYGLAVVRVALRRPCLRVVLPTRVLPDRAAQWRAVVAEAGRVSGDGRPVLIGTDSVAESEELSRWLTEAGLAHEVLNARHDAREATIVAEAGQAKRITVATNMAGRGVDIPLGPGVAERGGLHLICCQHNASRRIDRQLLGRCARQGDPGSSRTLISVEKPLLRRVFPAWCVAWIGRNGRGLPASLVALIVRLPQIIEERRQRALRRELLEHEDRMRRAWSMLGSGG